MFNVFFYVSIAIFVLGICVSFGLNKAKSKKNFSFYFFSGAVFLSAVNLFIPIYYNFFYKTDFCVFKTILLSVHNTIRLFVVDGEFNIITENVPQSLEIFQIYNAFAAVLFVVAPLLTFGIVVSFFKNIFTYQKLFINRNSEIYVFSELNEKSLALAESLYKNNKKRFLVFTDVFEKNEEQNYEMALKAKKLGAVCFRDDITKINFKFHTVKKDLVFVIIGSDDSENITQSLQLVEKYKDVKSVKLYLFSDTDSSKLALTGLDKGLVKVYRINEAQSLIFRVLYEKGEKIFDTAFCGDLDKEISALVVGLGSYGTQMLKVLSWFLQMDGYKAYLTAFDKEINAEKIFKSKCAELMSDMHNGDFTTSGEAHYQININSGIDVLSYDFDEKIKALDFATFIFVSLGNDELNIKIALKLREIFAAKGQMPLIFAVVYNPILKDSIQSAVNYKGENLNITLVGDIKESFSEKVVMNSDVEQLALQRHLKWGDENDFWNFEYNYRSSIASVIHKKMRVYCNIAGANKPAEERTEKEKYNMRILEHKRWNAYMRSEGYSYAVNRNDMAKQHNCLVPFDSLSEVDKIKDDD